MSFHSSHLSTPRPCADHGTSHGGHRGLLLLALGGLLAACWCGVRHTHQRRMTGRSEAPPKRLQTWENEGGRPLDDEGAATLSSPDSPSPATPASPGPSSRS